MSAVLLRKERMRNFVLQTGYFYTIKRKYKSFRNCHKDFKTLSIISLRQSWQIQNYPKRVTFHFVPVQSIGKAVKTEVVGLQRLLSYRRTAKQKTFGRTCEEKSFSHKTVMLRLLVKRKVLELVTMIPKHFELGRQS